MKTVTRREIGQLCALFGAATLAGALVTGCLSTTLPPFPPPSEPQTMTYEAPGLLVLKGVVIHQQATVYAHNIETGDIGGKQVHDGTYSLIVRAAPGQELELYYQIGNDVSASTFFFAPEPDAPPADGSTAAPDAGAVGDAAAIDAAAQDVTSEPPAEATEQ